MSSCIICSAAPVRYVQMISFFSPFLVFSFSFADFLVNDHMLCYECVFFFFFLGKVVFVCLCSFVIECSNYVN